MNLEQKLNDGHFITLVEFTPPKGNDVTEMIENASRIKGMVDGLVISDLSGAVMRMSALGAAVLLRREGFSTIMEINCRDRNRLALQADLLAASAHDIANIIVTTGDDINTGDHPEAKPVFDTNVLALIEGITNMRQGKDMAGRPLSGAPAFVVGAETAPTVDGKQLESEVETAKKLSELGTAFFVTPPIFDVSAVQPFLNLVDGSNIKLIPRVLLLKSLGMARYIDVHNDLVTIPPSLFERIENTDEVSRELIHIASEIVATLKKKQFGGVLLCPMGWEHRLPEILGSYQDVHSSENIGD